jgi:hypothetical protein
MQDPSKGADELPQKGFARRKKEKRKEKRKRERKRKRRGGGGGREEGRKGTRR